MFYIGASGWAYTHWRGNFYPENLPSRQWFEFYGRKFNTVEVNYSFYHLPSEKTYQKWREEAPRSFVFAVKISRYISHIKRLKDISDGWKRFYSRAQLLNDKLGPFLLQLPPNFLFSQENLARLEKFLAVVKNSSEKIKLAVELRHQSWDNQNVFEILRKYNTALVVSDSSRWPEIIQSDLADFIYLRFHGPRELFASDYSSAELKNWAKNLKKWGQNKDIFAYFNNDFHGFAPQNAEELKELVV